jgi:mannose-1-phosphate guanylyltransferase/phosphomannomutase
MMETAIEKDVVFVGEETGGFIFPQFQPAFDGMFAIVKILEMMAKANTRFHKLVREIPQSFKIEEKVPCPWELKGKIMRGLIEDAKGEDVQLLDGIKIFKKNEWVIAYPSQDNAYFHVIGESPTRDKASILVNKYVDKIRNWQVR